MMRSLSQILVLSTLAFLVGCSSDERVATVHGTITLDGKPVGEASITFMPQEGGRPAFGVSDADGTYELTTFTAGDGALIGKHLVSITAVDENAVETADSLEDDMASLSDVVQRPKRRPKEVWRTPQRYSENETSGLTFEVVAGKTNQADFPLTSTAE